MVAEAIVRRKRTCAKDFPDFCENSRGKDILCQAIARGRSRPAASPAEAILRLEGEHGGKRVVGEVENCERDRQAGDVAARLQELKRAERIGHVPCGLGPLFRRQRLRQRKGSRR